MRTLYQLVDAIRADREHRDCGRRPCDAPDRAAAARKELIERVFARVAERLEAEPRVPGLPTWKADA